MRSRTGAFLTAGVLVCAGTVGLAARWWVWSHGRQGPGTGAVGVTSTAPAGPRGAEGAQPASLLDLRRLAPEVRQTLSLLLLLPLGVLVTAVFRSVIGVQTFGTFTPSLIALTFAHADLAVGALVLFGVLAIGIGGRRLLDPLHLLMAARLGLVLTLAVLFLAVAVSVCDLLGLAPSAAVVLLPTLILTMMIERFHISSEENGLSVAFRQLGWSLVVGLCCWALFRQAWLANSVLACPESLFFVAAGLVLTGQYTGYRLVELWRFRDLARSQEETAAEAQRTQRSQEEVKVHREGREGHEERGTAGERG